MTACFWCQGERPEVELYRCFYCKTLVCEGCGDRHFGPDPEHARLALEAKFWKDRALRTVACNTQGEAP